MSAHRGRVALVTGAAAEPASAQTGDLRGLLDRGWDARLVSPGSERRLWSSEPQLAARTARCWRRAQPLGAGLALARAAARNPNAASAALRGPSSLLGVWCKRQLAGHLVALRPDLVHFDCGSLAAEWLAIAEALDCPLVVGLTAEDLHGARAESFEGYDAVLARAATVHFPDRALEQRALRRGWPAEAPRAVIPPLVDTGFFAPAAEPGDQAAPAKLRIASADALEWMQGFEHAIHAVSLLRDAGVDSEYTVIGDGDHLAALTFARHQLGVAEQVHFAGAVSATELRSQLRSADVFLSPAVVDGIAWTALQALACGTPVVMSDPGPIGDAGIDERAVRIVPRRDPEALAAALAALAGDERLRREMGLAARDWAVRNVSPDQRFTRLNDLFRRVLAPPDSAH